MLKMLIVLAATQGAGPWFLDHSTVKTHQVVDELDFSTRLQFSPPDRGSTEADGRVSFQIECRVLDTKTNTNSVYNGTGVAVLREGGVGGHTDELGFSLWIPGSSEYEKGFVQFDDDRCASGIPDFGTD